MSDTEPAAIDRTLVAELEVAMAPRLEALQERLARLDRPVELVAVSKGQPVEAVVAAMNLGVTTFGENYANELRSKHQSLVAGVGSAPTWHFIGRLQRNRIREIAPLVTLWQSIDRARLVDELAKRSAGASVLLQVDPAANPDKAGCPPEEVAALHEHATVAGLRVDGLMVVGVDGDDHASGAAFETVVDLADELALPIRSIGMSADLESALRAGSTMIRPGSLLFGPRPPQAPTTAT